MSAHSSQANTVEIIHVEKLQKIYGRAGQTIQALRNVSFSVQFGEIFALLGPNGAGKTTLIKIIMNFIRPTAGHVIMMGHDVANAAAREAVGYVPEEISLPDFSTARLMLEFLGRLSHVPPIELKARIPQLLQDADLAGIQQPVKKFSKGMKRRLSLAQALLHRPALLILDEPTDGLDPAERNRVLKMLRAFRDQGGTILLCSHILSEVETLCDRYLILKQGSIIHEGSKDDFKADGHFILLATAVPDKLTGFLPQGCAIETLEGKSAIRVREQKNLTQLLSFLDESGLPIKEIVPCRSGLNRFFIEHLEESNIRER